MLLIKSKIDASNFAYLIPYTPGPALDNMIASAIGDAKEFYNNMIASAKKLCREMGIHCISLSHFTDADKAGTIIPEPTKQGARKIAQEIIEWI